MPAALTIIPIGGIGEIHPGDELAESILEAATAQQTPLANGDCLVVTQKVVSKVEGISFIYFDDRDVVRHKLVQQIVKAYESFLSGKKD